MTLAAAALAGFAVLVLEVLGVHWLAPWFGASSLVWSNQIGVVLAALALGGWLGGRRARKSPRPGRLAGALLAGAGFLVVVAVAALPAFAGWVLPEDLRLEEAAPFFLGGSLGAALLFLAPPVLLLGMVAPLLVEVRAADRGPGRAAGEISAAGTVGSLVGVFGGSLLAIPLLGVRPTLLLVAVALLVAGLLLWRRLPRGGAAIGLLPLLLLIAGDPAATANLPRDGEGRPARVLAVTDSPYQHLRVVELAGGERWLQMNEGLDSYQAVWRPDSLWPGGYYDLFVLAPVYAFAGVGNAAGPARFWVLGWGAGSVLGPVVAGLQGRPWEAVGIEIDPTVVELGRQWLPLPDEAWRHLHVLGGGDARAMLRAAPADLDFLVVDVYARQFEIPLHLATEEFFREAAGHLRPGGVLAVNVGTAVRPGAADPVLGPLRAGLAAAFAGEVRLHRVPASRNAVLFARKDRPLPELAALAELLPAGVPVAVGTACRPSHVAAGGGDAHPFRDGRNPLGLDQALLWLRAEP